jgi:spermidine synthase
LEKTSERFDFISVDLVEPLEEGPACLLFTKEFYALIRDRLTPGGAMTLQAGMTKLGELDFFTSIHRTLREVFPVVAGYQTFMSCFGTPWGFITATKKVDPTRQDAAAIDRLIAERIKGITPLVYWDGQTHVHAFTLPKHLRGAIAAQTRVVTDANPLIVA